MVVGKHKRGGGGHKRGHKRGGARGGAKELYVLNRLGSWLSGRRRARFIHLAFLQRFVRGAGFGFGRHDQIILFIVRSFEQGDEFFKSRKELLGPHSLRAGI